MDQVPDRGEARRALEEAQARTIDSPRDRTIHGVATAGFGILLAVFVTWFRSPDGPGLALVVYVVLLVALALWQTRAARTVPLASRRIGYIGLALTVIITLPVTIWRNAVEGSGGSFPLALQVIAALLIALPTAVAGGLIIRGRR